MEMKHLLIWSKHSISIIFSKVFKTLLKIFLNFFQCCLKIENDVCQSVHNTFGVPSLCNLQLQKFSFLSIKTLQNDCSHIEDVHHLFSAHFMNIFLVLRGVELRHFFIQNC